LACFLDAPGIVLSRDELIAPVWNGRATSDSALSVATQAQAEALADEVDRHPRNIHNEGSISRALGILARALSDPREAVGHFEIAAARNAAIGLKARALRSQYELARLLLDVDEVRDVARGQRLLGELHEGARSASFRCCARWKRHRCMTSVSRSAAP
jgi:hypothetical protein